MIKKALEITPGYVLACNNLAWMLATSPEESLRNGARALELAREAYGISGDSNPMVIRTLAAACAEAGRFPEAEETAQRALRVADLQGYERLGVLIQKEISLYRSHVPFHRAKRNGAAGGESPPAQ